jgi:hypothetical protein
MLTRRESGGRTDLYYTLRRDQGLDQDTDAIRVSDIPDSVVGQCRPRLQAG